MHADIYVIIMTYQINLTDNQPIDSLIPFYCILKYIVTCTKLPMHSYLFLKTVLNVNGSELHHLLCFVCLISFPVFLSFHFVLSFFPFFIFLFLCLVLYREKFNWWCLFAMKLLFVCMYITMHYDHILYTRLEINVVRICSVLV